MPLRVVSSTRESPERFTRGTYLGRSLSRFPAAVAPEATILFENGSGDRVPHGLPEVYNAAIDQADGDDILAFVHDDVYIHDWFFAQRVTDALAQFDIVGVAGSVVSDIDQPAWIMGFDRNLRPTGAQPDATGSGVVNHFDYGVPQPDTIGPTPMECHLLDGLLLVARVSVIRAAGVHFDTAFQFHLYDIDFCRSARAAGLRLGTWPIAVTHASMGLYDDEAFRSAAREYIAKWQARGLVSSRAASTGGSP